jgi:hypothetical protein
VDAVGVPLGIDQIRVFAGRDTAKHVEKGIAGDTPPAERLLFVRRLLHGG